MIDHAKAAVLRGPVVVLCLLTNACTVQQDRSGLPESISALTTLEHSYNTGQEGELLVYDIVSVDETGAESPYGTMELHTRSEGDTLWIKDIIELVPQYAGVTFVRTLTFHKKDLLHPVSVTLDISTESETTRQMSYSDGIFSVYGRDPVKKDFPEGILTYNAMLRLVRLLDMSTPRRYTFPMYAEPFLFRVHEPEEGEIFCLEALPKTEFSPYATSMSICVFMQIKSHRTEIYLDKNRKPTVLIEHFSEGKMAVFKLR